MVKSTQPSQNFYPKRNEKGQFIEGSSNPWNKGKKCPQLSTRKGKIPWNKGIKGWMKDTKAGFQKGNALGRLRREIKMTKKQRIKLSRVHIGIQAKEKHPNWKGGISKINEKERTLIEYRLWRESVFARDHWTCQKCSKKGEYLEAHHIKSFANYPKLRFAIDNGITLCKKCHKETDNYGGKNAKK